MEGISNEACSIAGHWGLGKLIAFYDDNHISIDGDTEIAFTESVDTRFEGLGWHVIWVKNGNTGYDEIRAAIKEATAVKDKPTLIKVRCCLHTLLSALLRVVRSMKDGLLDNPFDLLFKLFYFLYFEVLLLFMNYHGDNLNCFSDKDKETSLQSSKLK